MMRGGAWLAGVLLVISVCGCGGGDSTRISIEQYQAFLPTMAQKFRTSRFLAARTPSSPAGAVSIVNVKNLTTDVIPLSLQWNLMAQLAGLLSELDACRATHLEFHLPPDRVAFLRRYGKTPEQMNLDPPTPTHIMSSVFRSVRRAGRDDNGAGHEDGTHLLYMLSVQIVDVTTREMVFQGNIEFEVKASGRSIN
jgi:hypothetical protein